MFAAATAEAGVVLVEFDGVEQGDGLKFVARGVGTFFLNDAAAVDGVLHGADDEGGADEFHEFIAISHGFVEIVAGVDVDQRERRPGGPERLPGQPSHDNRVLAAGKKQRRILELRGCLAQDKNRFGLDLVEMV